MRHLYKLVAVFAVLLAASGCGLKTENGPSQAVPVHTPHLSAGAESNPPLVPAAPAPETPKYENSQEAVSEAQVTQLLKAAHERPYTVDWDLGGPIDTKGYGNWMLAEPKGRAGVMPDGDRYVRLKYSGFVHKGNQAWYLRMNADGSWTSEGPEIGFLHQRPGIKAWEGIQPDQLGVLDAIWRNRLTFHRATVTGDTEVWTVDVPPRKTSVELFGSYREVMAFNITVKRFDEAYLPVKFHLTWWDAARIITFDGTYDWSPPVFPQVTEKAALVQKSGG